MAKGASIGLRLEEEVVARIDRARGEQRRSAWVRDAILHVLDSRQVNTDEPTPLSPSQREVIEAEIDVTQQRESLIRAHAAEIRQRRPAYSPGAARKKAIEKVDAMIASGEIRVGV